ncbi:ectoine synthase [Breoghania sp. L-A4]|uniref:ectoine synthase n=1 Tax=Breoghania sp. L-A4 TaxID=2304600 RepID=UPI0013C333A7|nr:ectoine synthase [Breoghania sp. L-A4]
MRDQADDAGFGLPRSVKEGAVKIRSYAERRQDGYLIERPSWDSVRMALAEDRLGYSLHVTRLHAGDIGAAQYPEHVEAAYCMDGRGTITYGADDEHSRPIEPGVMFVLDQHDRYRMHVSEPMTLLCVFTPAFEE